MTNTFANLFSESRKYGICLCVAHQYIGQLTGEIKTTVLGNTGTILIFRVGGDDAAQLVSEMAPIFDSQDMINLGVREFYIKMLIDGQSYDPFSAQTLPMYPPEYASSRKAIIDYNRVAYATPLAKVKEEYKKIMDPLRNETKKAPPAEKEKEKEDAHQEPLI